MKNIIIFLVVIAVVGFWSMNAYNSLVVIDEDANVAWSKVESAYQRRADLIPNLVNTVKGYADFEKSTLTDVIKARAGATGITIDPSNITPEQMKQFQGAQSQLTGALSRLLVTVERYPDLKANQGFRDLQSQLEGTENRIKVERDRYNNTIGSYNKTVRQFPKSLFAGIFGFVKRSLFESKPGSEEAPEVKF